MPWFPMRTGARIIRALCADFMRHPISVCSLSILYLTLGCTLALAQSSSPTVVDKDVPTPTAIGQLGQQDTGALNEILNHLKVVGPVPWTGMQGTGQITYGTKDSTAYSATLSILGATEFRLDGQTSNSQMSIRISGGNGNIQEEDSRRYPIIPDTALSGIFQFELPRLADFPIAGMSLVDRGSVTIDGTSFHRLTYEIPGINTGALAPTNDIVVTDLYFDSTTHLLVKSANSIRIDGAGNNDFLRVITYSDYRKVGNSLIPFSFTQTLDGQKQWTLQLSEVQLNPAVDTAFFQF